MKWLIGLSALQTLLIVLLGIRMIAIDMRTDEIADAAEAAKLAAQSLAAQPRAQAPQPIAQLSPSAPVSEVALDNEALRLIIRQELAAWNASGRMTSRDGGQQAITNSTRESAKPYDPAQAVVAQAAFDQEFDRYKARGRIDNREMMELHAKIAELPPEAQRAALIKLTRAINNGEIDGNL